MIAINMPQVGQDIPSARIIEWRKAENEPVEKGEVVLVVESDKATFEVEAEESGVLLKILHHEDEDVEIFRPLAYIGQPGETFDEAEPAPVAEATGRGQSTAEPEAGAARGPARPRRQGAAASPAARRAARERGVDLQALSGSGPGGRITKRDVVAATVPAAPQAGPEDTVVPFGKMRKRIADRLTKSQQTVPTFGIYADVDMSEAARWRKAANQQPGTRITVTDMIIKACAAVLADFPRMNAHVYLDRMVLRRHVNVGVAVSVEDGLLVPVIPDADRKGLPEISQLSKKNAEAAMRGAIVGGAEGTFTISSLGMHNVSRFVPIINPPECAILGVGSIEQRVVSLSGGIQLRDMMTLTLVCDHRAVDGSYAARFLNRIKGYLQDFANELETGT